MFSMNKLVVEAYEGDRSLRSNNATGFAMIDQRSAIKGLKTLADAWLAVGSSHTELVPKGSMVYIREELFFQPGWAQKIYTSDDIEGRFIIVDPVNVEFINPADYEIAAVGLI
jgi:hypothetical protein